jgi:hypothetical protein
MRIILCKERETMRRRARAVRCHSFAYSRERSRLTATPHPSVLLQRVFSNFEIVAVSRLPLGALFSFFLLPSS